jgi:hypothetical protein
MLRVIVAFALLALAQGFLVAPLATRSRARSVTPMMGYAETAENCLEEGCSVDTVEELIADMKAAKNPTKEIITAIAQLEALIAAPGKNQNEIEKLVFAAARSFSTVKNFEFPGAPLGYTGVPGTTTVAGKALDY